MIITFSICILHISKINTSSILDIATKKTSYFCEYRIRILNPVIHSIRRKISGISILFTAQNDCDDVVYICLSILLVSDVMIDDTSSIVSATNVCHPTFCVRSMRNVGLYVVYTGLLNISYPTVNASVFPIHTAKTGMSLF